MRVYTPRPQSLEHAMKMGIDIDAAEVFVQALSQTITDVALDQRNPGDEAGRVFWAMAAQPALYKDSALVSVTARLYEHFRETMEMVAKMDGQEPAAIPPVVEAAVTAALVTALMQGIEVGYALHERGHRIPGLRELPEVTD